MGVPGGLVQDRCRYDDSEATPHTLTIGFAMQCECSKMLDCYYMEEGRDNDI